MGHHPGDIVVGQTVASGGFSSLDVGMLVVAIVIIGGWIFYSIKNPKKRK